jgi:hypothetical protein
MNPSTSNHYTKPSGYFTASGVVGKVAYTLSASGEIAIVYPGSSHSVEYNSDASRPAVDLTTPQF